MLPEGTYLARGISLVVGASKKGTEGATVAFRIEDGPQKDMVIEWTGWLSENARLRTIEALGYCGYDGENEKSVGTNQVQLVVEHEDYVSETTGRTSTNARVKWVNSPGSGAMLSGADAGKQAEIKNNLRGLMMAHRQAKPAAAPAPVAAPKAAVKF